jgi:hypothetical protein
MRFLSSPGSDGFNLNGMRQEITPDPSSEEREAIEEALARLVASPPDPRSAWWRAGLAEELSEEEERA